MIFFGICIRKLIAFKLHKQNTLTTPQPDDNCIPILSHSVIKEMTIELHKNPTLGISITGGINGENLCHPGDPNLYVYNMAEQRCQDKFK